MGLIKPTSAGISLPALSNPAGAENIQSGYEAIDGNGNKITGLHTEPTVADFTNDATAHANMILKGKTAYVKGEKITGTILNQLGETITPGTADKTIKAGKYLAGTLTIKGDANLKAANIKSGVSIFGVAGSVEAKGDMTTLKITWSRSGTAMGARKYFIGEQGEYTTTNTSFTNGTVEEISIRIGDIIATPDTETFSSSTGKNIEYAGALYDTDFFRVTGANPTITCYV